MLLCRLPVSQQRFGRLFLESVLCCCVGCRCLSNGLETVSRVCFVLLCRLPVSQQRFGGLFLESAAKIQALYYKYSANHPCAVAVLQSKR